MTARILDDSELVRAGETPPSSGLRYCARNGQVVLGFTANDLAAFMTPDEAEDMGKRLIALSDLARRGVDWPAPRSEDPS